MIINLVKTLSGYKPAFDTDLEKSKKHALHDIITFEYKQQRNLKFHRKFYAMLDLAYQNQDVTAHREAFRKWMIREAGYYEVITYPDGTSEKIAKSISFAKMDEDEFESLFQDVLQVAITVIGAKKEEIMENLINFM